MLGNARSGPCGHTAISPSAQSKSLSALVETALAFDELNERFGMIFVLQGIPQNSRPFGAGTLVNLGRIGCAADDCGERLVVLGWADVI